MAVGGEYRPELSPSGIQPELLVDCLEPALGRQGGNAVQLHGDHTVGPCDEVIIDLPVDEPEQDNDENRKCAGDHQRPVEGVRAEELRLAHRNFAARICLVAANRGACRLSHLTTTMSREE